MKLRQNAQLLMIGDSITDAGRARPVGEGPDGLGDGYVALVDGLMKARYPELGTRTLNLGISGNTVRHLAERWQTDVLDLKPDWLTIMIGTNDVWRQFDNPTRPEEGVQPDEFARTLGKLVTQTLPNLKGGLILLTPFYIQTDRSDAMRARMDEYGTLVRDVASRHDTLFVDTQAAFDTALLHLDFTTIAPDRVHPTRAGHMILARAVLQALDFAW